MKLILVLAVLILVALSSAGPEHPCEYAAGKFYRECSGQCIEGAAEKFGCVNSDPRCRCYSSQFKKAIGKEARKCFDYHCTDDLLSEFVEAEKRVCNCVDKKYKPIAPTRSAFLA